MWKKLTQRLSDPVFYRKHARRLARSCQPPQAPRPISAESLFGGGLDRSRPIVIVTAHPDDEFFASGLICEAAARNVSAEILCLTRGEGGPVGNGTREELGQRRERELRAAASALGVSRVTFLGHVDPIGREHRTYAPDVSETALAGQLRTLFDQRQPRLLVTHGSGGEYWHPAHLLLHCAVLRAAGDRLPILTFHAWQEDHALPRMLNRDDPADLRLDTARFREIRLAALRAHASQGEFFAGLGGGSLEQFVKLTEREAYRFYPVTTRRPASDPTPDRNSVPG